jgi:hypothetical protein
MVEDFEHDGQKKRSCHRYESIPDCRDDDDGSVVSSKMILHAGPLAVIICCHKIVFVNLSRRSEALQIPICAHGRIWMG